MLLFSEYFRELLQIKKISVSELARLSGVERTQLSKTLTGQRKLPYNALDEIIYHLRLTPGEEKQFRIYYDAQFEKEGIRRSREIVDSLFRNLACMDFDTPIFEETRLLMNLEQYAGERSIFSGETNVRLLMRMVISEEMTQPDARIELTFPPSDAFINTELLQRYLNGKNSLKISQILCFDASGNESDINLHNLECFCQVLPLCLLSGQHYHPYYYYDTNVTGHYTDPFPYFLVTHTCVVCLSEDGTCAMLLRSPDQISYYRKHFQSLVAQCYSLIQYTSNPLEILNFYQRCTDQDGFYMTMDQPCFGRFYSDKFISEHLREELYGYEQILGAAMERFSHLRKVSNFHTIFSESGLRRFMEDGTLDDFPVEFVMPFSQTERVWLMHQMISAIESGDVNGRIFQEGAYPSYLAMCTSSEQGIGFFTTRQFPLSEGLCSVWIREPNLCRAFHGWLTHLSGSSLTLTMEETVKVMEELIQKESV
ncbi:MAG: helix-turn-helix domain-containing protein [Lachnospiraceae bacterium]